MMHQQQPVKARIVSIETTKNAYVLGQTVRTLANGSMYTLRGVDMVDGGKVGDEVQILPMSRGQAHRAVGY